MTRPLSFALSRFRAQRRGLRGLLLSSLLLATAVSLASCKKGQASHAPERVVPVPTLRLYALAGAAGAVEPCGCVKDMLGGVDHAAAFIARESKKAPQSLVLGAGPMFFESPTVKPEEQAQQRFKAEAMAQSLADLGLAAWSPGANDWAMGLADFTRLCKQTGAKALAANLRDPTGTIARAHVVQRGDLSVGLIGISVPTLPPSVAAQPPGSESATPPTGSFSADPAQPALARELGLLKDTDINVALIAAPRGEALRLIEGLAKGPHPLQLAILGKPYDQGENNDTPIPPEIIDNTLVVQAPNHLQSIAVIDLFVRDGTGHFADGTGLQAHERRIQLEGRIDELSRRIERWKAPTSQVSAQDVAAQEAQLAELRKEHAAIHPTSAPEKGSYFLYDLVQVKEGLGQEPKVSARLSAYYQRVNEHNRVAFADRTPTPAASGEASFVGVDTCTNCHLEERMFWNGTGHAHAYATLETAHKEYNLDCVSCHVTGYELPGGSTVTHVAALKSVQCEVCHGPGSLHVTDPTKDGTIKAVPSRSLCASACHHAPHVGPDWSVDVAWPQILGKGHGIQ